ncbi:MAG: VOC family protein [Chloroflexi bacterium]|nr:VOC family protein [Chloroflexota bacterium]
MGAQINAVTLGVKDLQESKSFYEGLGASVDKEFPGFVSLKFGDASPDLALYPRDGLAAIIGVPPDGAGFSGIVLDYNPPGKGRDRVDEVLSQAERAGGKVVSPAHDAEWGGRVGHFSDPDGNLWQVASY